MCSVLTDRQVMAKRSKKTKKSRPSQRALSKNTKRKLLRRVKSQDYTDIMDHRQKEVLASHYPRDIDGRESRIVDRRRRYDNKRKATGYSNVRFINPMRAIVCRRRKNRRAVMFSLRIIGKGRGSGGFRRRVMKEFSHIYCG